MVTDNTTTALVIFAVAGVLGLLAIIGVDIITTIHEAEGRSNVAECNQIPTLNPPIMAPKGYATPFVDIKAVNQLPSESRIQVLCCSKRMKKCKI
jgi:hypothetical protein